MPTPAPRTSHSLSRSIQATVLLLIVAPLLLLGGYTLYTEWRQFQKESLRIKNTYLQHTKNILQHDVEGAVSLLRRTMENQKTIARSCLEQHVHTALAAANTLYTANQDFLNDSRLKPLVLQILAAAARSCPQGLGPDIVVTPLHAGPAPEGDPAGAAGPDLSSRLVELYHKRGPGFVTFTWLGQDSQPPDQAVLAYLSLFEPYNLVVAAMTPLEDITTTAQENALIMLDTLYNPEMNYLFAGTYNDLSLLGPARGEIMYGIEDENGVKVVQELIAAAKAGGGFVHYVMPRLPDARPAPKLSYSQAVPEWGWYIGAGKYMDSIDAVIQARQADVRADMISHAKTMAALLVMFLILGFLASLRTARRLSADLKRFGYFFDRAATQTDVIDADAVVFSELRDIARSANTMIAARHATETALKQTEATYRELFNASADGVIIYDPNEDSVIDANPAALAMYGGAPNPEAISPRFSGVLTEQFNELQQGKNVHCEILDVTLEGVSFWTECRAKLAVINGVDRILATVRDVTSRKAKETDLRRANALFRAIFEQSALGLIVAEYTQRSWRMTMANEEAQRILGVSRSELISRLLIDASSAGGHLTSYTLHDPENNHALVTATPLALAAFYEEKTVSKTFSLRQKNGAEAWVLFNAAPVYDAEGTLVAAVDVMTDVTSRMQSEEELRRISRLLQEIVDAMPSVLVGVNQQLDVTLWNRRAAEITGVPQNKALGRYLVALSPLFAKAENMLRDAMAQGAIREKTKQQGVLGEETLADLTAYPLLAKDVEGAVLRIDNVTTQARMEQLMAQNEKMRSVGGMAAGMAHEINNPLGVITQGAQNTLRRLSPDLPANAKAAEECGIDLHNLDAYLKKRNIFTYVTSIRDAADRAARIVANMLSFSRQSHNVHSPTNVNDLLEKTVELVSNDYELKKYVDFQRINIAYELDLGLPLVPCSALEIEQVSLNLLRNAAQALADIQRDEPRITIRTRLDAGWAVIEIEDNGPGMPEDVLKKAFEPFFTTKEIGKGAGLGLYVSYFLITHNHKGQFSVASVPGQWTRFTVSLPLTGKAVAVETANEE